MNIVEAYIKFNNGLIILLSGLSGSGKSNIASMIENDFKIKKINIEDFCVTENNRNITLTDDNDNKLDVKDWDHIDAYDWNAINTHINQNKINGVVVCGPYFPTNVLTFKPSFHIDIKISKQILIDRRHQYIEQHLKECPDFEKIFNTPFERIIINKITYSHYVEYRNQSKVDLTIDVIDSTQTLDNIYDNIFDFLMKKIQNFLDEYNKSIIKKTDNKKRKEKEKPTQKPKLKLAVNDKGRAIDEDNVYDLYNIPEPIELNDDNEFDDNVNPNETIYLGTT